MIGNAHALPMSVESVKACRLCGCTEDEACVITLPEGPSVCASDDVDPRICSFCAEMQQVQLVYQVRLALSLLSGIMEASR